MLEAYIDWAKAFFPGVEVAASIRAKEALAQFYELRREFRCFLDQEINGLCQGDILSDLPFTIFDSEGNEMELNTRGFVLSHSCDIENDTTLLIAPVFLPESTELDLPTLKNNQYYTMLYFPDEIDGSVVVDLGQVQVFPCKMIQEAFAAGRIRRIHSLNLIGYYLMINKVAVQFLRPDAEDVYLVRESST